MKKIIFLISLIGFLFAGQKVYIKNVSSGRSSPVNDGTNNFVSKVYPNIYPVVDEFGDYAKINIITAKITFISNNRTELVQDATEHIEAYITTKVLIKTNDIYIIGGSGATLRKGPSKHTKAIGFIWKNSLVKIIKLETTWIKIKNSWGKNIYSWDKIWVWIGLTEPVKE